MSIIWPSINLRKQSTSLGSHEEEEAICFDETQETCQDYLKARLKLSSLSTACATNT